MLQKLKNQNFFGILVFKIFCLFSQFLNEFELQVSGPSKRDRRDNFFEYWNLGFTFLKAGAMKQDIL